MTGMTLMYSGGTIGYKSKFQTVIAHSSTEAELIAACDTATMILFVRFSYNAQQLTRQTCHIEIKHFSLLDWVEHDLLILHSIPTQDNAADAMMEMLTKQLFINLHLAMTIPFVISPKA